MKSQKIIILSAMVGLLIPSHALAKPGQTLGQVKAWVQKHSFLPPQLIADTSFPGSYWVDRSLTNGKTITFSTFLEKGRVVADTIRIDYVSPLSQPYPDGLNLFERENAKTHKFFKTLYDAEVAQDFKQSSFAFKGNRHYMSSVHTNEETTLKHTHPVRIYFGKKYNYAIELLYPNHLTNKFSWEISVYGAKDKKNIFHLMGVIEKEQARYKNEMAIKKRNEPSDLDL